MQTRAQYSSSPKPLAFDLLVVFVTDRLAVVDAVVESLVAAVCIVVAANVVMKVPFASSISALTVPVTFSDRIQSRNAVTRT